MSAAEHGHDHSHDSPEMGHATFRGYMTGLVLAVILTAIPFWLVMGDVIDSSAWTITIIITLAAVQIVVHMVYFLHLDAKTESGWNLLSLIFTGMLLVIMLVGSLWIMFHLHENTMTPTAIEVRNMP